MSLTRSLKTYRHKIRGRVLFIFSYDDTSNPYAIVRVLQDEWIQFIVHKLCQALCRAIRDHSHSRKSRLCDVLDDMRQLGVRTIHKEAVIKFIIDPLLNELEFS